MPGAVLSFDHQAEDTVKSRFEQIAEHYDARKEGLETARFGAPPYKPVPPEMMYLDGRAWAKALKPHKVVRLTPFEIAEVGERPPLARTRGAVVRARAAGSERQRVRRRRALRQKHS